MRLSTRVNGFTGAAITRLDILDTLPCLKICVGYKLDGKTIDYFPSSIAALDKCQPIYEELAGWQVSTAHISEYEQLPPQARQYIARLEELISCPANLICVGPEREQTIHKRPVL
ncbi:Adenylosuccinate synthetase [subsurface metagenome]